MKMLNGYVKVLLLVLLALSLAACGQKTNGPAATSQAASGAPKAGGTYLIGISEPLTGAASSLGTPVVDGAKLAAQAINDAGGINGRQIELDIRDDKSTPDVAVQNFRALIAKGVYGIIGPNQGSNILAVAPVVDKEGIPTLAFGNTISITDGHPGIFRAQTNDLDNVKAALLFAKNNLKATKVGVVYTNDAYGTDAYKTAASLVGQLGLTMTAAEQVNYNATDTSPEWAKVLATKPEAILLWGSGSTMATALKNANQLGNKAPIIGAQGVATHQIIETAGQAAEGLYLLTLTAPDQITKEQEPLAKLLKAKHGDKYQLSPYDTIGWDAVHIYAKALETGGGDKSKFKSAVESIQNLALASGTYTFSGTDHDGLDIQSVQIVQVKGGSMFGVQKGFSEK